MSYLRERFGASLGGRLGRAGLSLGLALPLALGACVEDEPAPTGPEPCDPAPGRICTVLGSGIQGLSADGLGPFETDLYLPIDLTIGPDGDLYVLDWNNHRVRTLRDGVVETIIGTGELGDAGTGQPEGTTLVARDTSLNHPVHLNFAPNGDIIVSAWHNSIVMRYNPTTGFIERICGTGGRSYNGDGEAPLATLLNLPAATAWFPDGDLLISDQANQRVRVLHTDGTMGTVLGTGTRGYSGDGGPATAAEVNLPVSQSAPPGGRIETTPDGLLYLADTDNHAVRMVDTDGIVWTVAGTGTAGVGGEGEATEQALAAPADIAVASDGTLYIADTQNSCVRRVTTDGVMTTAAGVCGDGGYGGDGGPATAALIDRPYGIAMGPDDELYIADTHNNRIRVVYPE